MVISGIISLFELYFKRSILPHNTMGHTFQINNLFFFKFQVVLVQGHYLSFLPLCSRNEPVFLATCTPIAMPETRECVVQGATNVFTTIHSMDMKIVHVDKK